MQDVYDVDRMSVCRIDDQCVDPGFDQQACPLQVFTPHADGGGYAQAAEAVFVGIGVGLDFGDVAEGDQSVQDAVGIDDGEFFDLVALEDFLGLIQGGADGASDQAGAHDQREGFVRLFFKAQVAVGDDADELFVLVHDGDASDGILVHALFGVGYGGIRMQHDGVEDHSALFAFDGRDVAGHVLVDHTDTSFLGHSDGHGRFGNGVHGSRYDRGVEGDATREAALDGDFPGKNRGIGRYQQYVIVRESQAYYFVGGVGHRQLRIKRCNCRQMYAFLAGGQRAAGKNRTGLLRVFSVFFKK